ncbi:hypothetical protein F7U66_00500 [Vibrio parahaemolyticus]|nr:hypothetical protein [Vibrio parahaemolyticus]
MKIATALEWLVDAEHITVLAGAGMSADHGTPVFRGANGQYSVGIEKYGGGIYKSMTELATLRALYETPDLVWRFYRDRRKDLDCLSEGVHQGYYDLNALLNRLHGQDKTVSVITTNVDCAFQFSGFTFPILELHGSIGYLQCQRETCKSMPWVATAKDFCSETCCSECGSQARPNIYLFDDFSYKPNAHNLRNQYLDSQEPDSSFVAILIGAGKTIPTLILKAQSVLDRGGRVIIINNEKPPFRERSDVLWLEGRAEPVIHALWVEYMTRNKT